MKLPERWLNYSNGKRIQGTRFVACKVPLRETYSDSIPEGKSFSPRMLLEQFPQTKLVIDLTATDKYYNGEEFESRGVQYVKIVCKGHALVHIDNYRKFCEVVDNFLSEHPRDYLIAVHCTHGVNRTGYLIVRYMIEKMGYSPRWALRVFVRSRGHAIEREKYVSDLQNLFQKKSKFPKTAAGAL